MKHLRIVLKDGYEQSLTGNEAFSGYERMKESLSIGTGTVWFSTETPEHKLAINMSHVQYFELTDVPSKKESKS